MTDGSVFTSLLGAAEAAKPAGGAPVWQLAALFGVYFGGTAAVLLLVYAHRSGRTKVLARAGAVAGWVFRVPGWSALPVVLAVVGLLAAMLGGLYDIGYHIDYGRDDGPLGNPGHWPLLLGIFTTFAGGILALGMADQKDASPAWVRIGPGWSAPLGGVMLTGCMAFALATLGLDDVWHGIFGQDVTLWSPTHFVFLFGGILTVVGMLVLLKEGSIARARTREKEAADSPNAAAGSTDRQSLARAEVSIWKAVRLRVELLPGSALTDRGRALASGARRSWYRIQRAALLGGLLCGLELFLAEYDWGVPLYRQVWQPLLLAVFAGLIFTTARAWIGRGGAAGAWVVYLVVRLVGTAVPFLAGVSASSMPLFLAEMACVELLALGIDPRRRKLAFGMGAGLLCGTVGFAAEYGWSQIAMPLPWTEALLPEGLILAALGGIAGGVLGALLAAALRGELPPPRVARIACVGAFALLVGVAVNAGIKEVPDARAHIELTDVRPEPNREALATVRLEPADAADDANWLYILAWSGGEDRVVDRLRRVGDGVYRSTQPIPLSGTWKVGLRLQRGRERGAVPMRLPVDQGLPNAEQRLPEVVTADELKRALQESAGAALPAPASFTRPFGDDNLIVLRETKGNVAGWVWALGIGLTVAIWGLFIAGLSLGLGRMARRSGGVKPAPRLAPEGALR